ncbi:MAG: DNA polymerase I [Chloroflexi bacterium]|nr:DNA polymerase I [Chloroflexota bacterium]
MAELLVLVDGNALLHRAFHAIPPLTTSKGELVNAVYGFASTLIKVLNEQQPAYAAVAFDKAAPTFRHQQFDRYKANRAEAPEGLYDQMARVHQLLQALRIPIFELEGFEADDLLGTLAGQATGMGADTLIVTGDSDALQLVGPRVRVLTPRRTFADIAVFDAEAVRERYGLSPEQLIDLKGLKGDVSDNIPGVPGVGEKTATDLLTRFGSLDGVYAHLDELRPKLRELLEKYRDQAYQSQHLATIVRNVPVQLDLEACRVGNYDRSQVIDLLRELDFRSLVGRIPAPKADIPAVRPAPSAVNPVQVEMFGPAEVPLAASGPALRAVHLGETTDYRLVDSEDQLEALITRLASAQILAVDTETTHQEPMRADLVGLPLRLEPRVAYYLPLGHRGSAHNLPVQAALESIRPFLEDPKLPKYGHNLKYDHVVLANAGVELQGIAFDTMLASYLLEPATRAHNLKDVAWSRLAVEMTPISDLIDKTRSMADVAPEAACAYSCADADISLRLAGVLQPELEKMELMGLFREVEMPLVPVLARMERNGIMIDVPFLHHLSDDLHHKIAELEGEIYRVAGRPFNINSTRQLATILFEELRLPALRRTKTGYSTAASVLDDLRGVHPLVDLILDYRQLVKLKSTYVDALPLLVNQRTGRVHTSFNQAVTATGRLSSSDPNLQNIPIRTELGRQVRRAFIVDGPENVLLAADYSQIEMRILAHICNDPRLVAAFLANEDIHAATAAEVFGVPLSQVNADQRRKAKEVNFGLIYGMSDFGLASRVGVSQSEAAHGTAAVTAPAITA